MIKLRPHLGVRHGHAVALVAVLGLAVPAGAGALPPGGPRPSHNGAKVTLHNTRVKPGGRIRVSGAKWPAAKSVSIKLDDEKVGVIGVLKINRRGRFNGSVTVPRNVLRVIRPGRHWLRLLAPSSSVNHQSSTSVKRYFTLVR